MKNNTTKLLTSLASTAMLLAGSSHAANTFYEVGDLILYFQKPGNTNTVYVSLGNAASNFRGSAAGPTYDRQALNILNINTTLVSAFGENWASDANIYAGAAAAHSADFGDDVVNGDQNRTMYISRGRASVGTVGQRGTAPYDLNSAQTQTTGSTNIIAMGNTFEVNGTAQQQVITTNISTIDNQNPITNASLGIQGTAFNAFSGGVQQRGAATTIGNFGFGGVTYAENVEFALDLYRIAPMLDSATEGEVSGEVGGKRLIGTFEGTLAVSRTGDVSFVTIPEPSSIALTGLAALGLAFRRRRSA